MYQTVVLNEFGNINIKNTGDIVDNDKILECLNCPIELGRFSVESYIKLLQKYNNLNQVYPHTKNANKLREISHRREGVQSKIAILRKILHKSPSENPELLENFIFTSIDESSGDIIDGISFNTNEELLFTDIIIGDAFTYGIPEGGFTNRGKYKIKLIDFLQQMNRFIDKFYIDNKQAEIVMLKFN